MEAFVEQRKTVPSLFFCQVHRCIRVAQDCRRIRVGRRNYDPDTRGDRELLARAVDRRLQQSLNALGSGYRVLDLVNVSDDERELVTTQTCRGLPRAEVPLEPFSHLP